MIKLKNLWKIALATMAMSAMLVACDTETKGGSDNDGDSASLGGVGVYSYTVNIADISTQWGGTTESPAFSVVLLTDAGLEKCTAEANFKVNPATAPEYQIGAFGDMKIKDTASVGNFAVYGKGAVDDVFQYYNGVAATVEADSVTVYVDMTKLVITDLKALWEGDSEAIMTAEDFVDLTGYKPYVVALGLQANDATNYKFNAWSADVMAMEEGATFPAGDLKKDAPVVLGFDDVTTIAGSLEGWKNATALTNGSYTFTYETSLHQINDGTDTNTIQFKFTNGTWDLGFCGGAKITALGADVEMAEGGDNVELPVSLLEVGKSYTITITKVDKHNGKVKVSAN